jgi:hypothetical protein
LNRVISDPQLAHCITIATSLITETRIGASLQQPFSKNTSLCISLHSEHLKNSSRSFSSRVNIIFSLFLLNNFIYFDFGFGVNRFGEPDGSAEGEEYGADVAPYDYMIV